ncbi:hypothetical protein DM02DRAFT_663111 [Periconia macrospinosa]|uniref:Uncharacterized protein n=1 Tax=Periconia macrospinosa TaxID=97972 RepID=A0A2V1D448_9PLEO|nr:hypothetical protein DM02DRAFT_663111 [Periconia macrospinosa]
MGAYGSARHQKLEGFKVEPLGEGTVHPPPEKLETELHQHSAHRQPTKFATSHFEEPLTRTTSPLTRITSQTPGILPLAPYNTADYQTTSSTVASTPCRRGGSPSTHPTKSEEIRARALILSRLDSAPKRNIAFVELRHDELLLPLRSAAGHIGT